MTTPRLSMVITRITLLERLKKCKTRLAELNLKDENELYRLQRLIDGIETTLSRFTEENNSVQKSWAYIQINDSMLYLDEGIERHRLLLLSKKCEERIKKLEMSMQHRDIFQTRLNRIVAQLDKPCDTHPKMNALQERVGVDLRLLTSDINRVELEQKTRELMLHEERQRDQLMNPVERQPSVFNCWFWFSNSGTVHPSPYREVAEAAKVAVRTSLRRSAKRE